MRRIKELDGIRGLAAITVVLFHYFASSAGALEPIFSAGWMGVDCFFVLSGYLIVGILLDFRGAPGYFSGFYTRRAFRIFPIYYLFLAAVYASSALLARTNHDLPPFWIYATYSQNWYALVAGNLGGPVLGVTWSLAIEEYCYLILPLAVRYVSRRILACGFCLMLVILPMSRVWLEARMGQTLVPSLVTRADGLLAGALLALLVRDGGVWGTIIRHKRWLGVAGIVLSATATSLVVAKHHTPIKFTLVAAMFTVIIATLIASPDGRLAALCRLRLLQWLGTISYGLYLYHQMIRTFVAATANRLGVHVHVELISLILSILASYVSWHVLERRLVEMGRRLGSRSRAVAAGQLAE